jgi:hypothetical protein
MFPTRGSSGVFSGHETNIACYTFPGTNPSNSALGAQPMPEAPVSVSPGFLFFQLHMYVCNYLPGSARRFELPTG